MLVADCASEALTTEDELRRERSGGVQCEAQASLSALRRELPPVLCTPALELWLLLQLNSLLRVPYCACTFDPQIRLLGWLPRTRPPLRPGLLRTWLFSPQVAPRSFLSPHFLCLHSLEAGQSLLCCAWRSAAGARPHSCSRGLFSCGARTGVRRLQRRAGGPAPEWLPGLWSSSCDPRSK